MLTSEWGVTGACIHRAGEDLDDTDSPIPDSIDRVLALLGIVPDNIDLVLDLGSITDERALTFFASWCGS